MNYLQEIDSFVIWLDTNQIPKSAIALWHALMHINYRADWDSRFAVTISVLESRTGFKKSDICEARNILQQKGRIKWQKTGGSGSAMYEIIPFCVRIADAKAYAKAYTNPDTIPNTNLTQTGSSLVVEDLVELFIVVENEKKSLKRIQDLFEVDAGLIENWKTKKLPPGEFLDGVKAWVIRNHKKEYGDFQKARNHFLFWMPNYLKDKKPHTDGEPKQQSPSVSKPAIGNKSGGFSILDEAINQV